MKKFYILLSILLFLILSGCATVTPVVIAEPPKSNITEDMTIEEYLHYSTEYRIKIEAYLNELLSQIKHKVPHIDMRRPGSESQPLVVKDILNEEEKTLDTEPDSNF